jgi:hypothetical protein
MIRLLDFNLVMTKGQVAYVEKAKAESSQELQNARRVRGVELRYVERCIERVGESVLKPATIYNTPVEVAPVITPVPLASFSTTSTNVPPSIDNRGSQYTPKSPEGVSKLELESVIGKHVEALGDRLEQKLVKAISQIQVTPVVIEKAGETKVEKKEEIPLFIPDRLVKSDMKGDVTIKKDQTEASGVSDAASMLKEMKKRGKNG